MKYCPKCGKENESSTNFCSSCGSSFNEETVVKSSKKKKEGLGTASLVLGIISLILSFTCIIIIPIIISVPLSIVGLVLGIVNVSKKGKKFAGIILNSLALAFSLLIAFVIAPIILSLGIFGVVLDEASKDGSSVNKFLNELYNEIDYSTSDNYVEGVWNCKNYDGSGEDNDYSVTFELNDDKTFRFGKYNDLISNHASGTYTYDDEKSKNEETTNGYKYFIINLTGDEYIVDSQDQNKEFNAKFEMGITSVNTKKQAILINYYTDNMYYCYKE